MMNKINTFHSANISQLRAHINKALADVENEFGIKISLGTMRYDANSVSVKLSLETESAVADSQNFPNKGVKFIYNGETFTVTGYKPRSFKYPYIAVNQKGKSYKFSANAVTKSKTL